MKLNVPADLELPAYSPVSTSSLRAHRARILIATAMQLPDTQDLNALPAWEEK